MSCAGLIVAGGCGQRFGGHLPKQYQLLRERPLLIWTVDAFVRCSRIDVLVLVVAAEERHRTNQLLVEHDLEGRVTICDGGAERVDSVQRGLAALPASAELVAIHDAARPLISEGLIERVIAAAERSGAAIAALQATDTVKVGATEGTIKRTLHRGSVFLAQTPQVFRTALLRKAYDRWEKAGRPPVTDDAQLVERLKQPVTLVSGEAANIKITVADDLALAEALLAKDRIHLKVPRVGVGYDVHRLEPGRRLVLGGVEIEHETGLAGHSDADVLAHAIGDAMLGAASLGDLGKHFPPSDPRYKGADSLELLSRIRQLVGLAGYRVAHVDSVVACEVPKLAPHIGAMRQRIAAALEVVDDRVSVKATTTEGLGAIGRREGMTAYATATLVPR